MAGYELFQLELSHFNEKARWALDFKGVLYVKRTLLPGFHQIQMQRLSGQPRTPVLRYDGQVIAGSAAIIEHLERAAPEPALYPAGAEERRRAIELQAWFDAHVGPAIRRAMFAQLMTDPAYFIRFFTDGRGAVARTGYRVMFPKVMALMRRDLGISPEDVELGLETTRDALDLVAREAGPGGYLAGARFSVADLTAAALLMPAALPAGGPAFPQPHGAVLQRWVALWADHPGVAWVRETYRRHRAAPAGRAASGESAT